MGGTDSEKPNPNKKSAFYFANIIFLCMITALSLAAAVILFVRLERLRSEKGVEGKVYTDAQIEKVRYAAAETERNRILLDIQSSFESGYSTISMLRDLFPGDLVVMWEGRYYFYPVNRNLVKNEFDESDFSLGENGFMEYKGENENVSVSRGIDVSSLNGEIDWEMVSEDRIAFAMMRAAYRDTDGNLVQDERFQENMSGAKSAGLHTGCYVDLDADSEESAEEIADFVLSHLPLSQQEMGAPVAVRVQIPDHTSSLGGQTREEWTRSVRAFCAKIQKAGYEPVIYANTAAFYMLLNMDELEKYGKWIADYEPGSAGENRRRRVKKKSLTPGTAACIIMQVMEKIVEQGLLYDFYGSLLTKHQQEIYEKVVYENLSLNEVAETEGVSKQAVHDLVRRCTIIMRGYEEKLGMIRRFGRIRESADRLRELAASGEISGEHSARLSEIAEEICTDLES